MKAQISTEYMMVVGLALLLTLPTVAIFYSQTATNMDQVNSVQAKQISRKIVDNAEKVYYLGQPSTTTLKVLMPTGIQTINITNRAFIITLSNGNTVSDIVEISSVNLTGNLNKTSGVQYIRIENIGDRVNISYSSS